MEVISFRGGAQGCQMVYFQTKKNPILGKFLEGIGMENVGMCNL
jgi:hypothetical protein